MLRCSRKTLAWDIAYICYFVSFFISDMAFVSEDTQNSIEKLIRYLAYFMFVVVLCLQNKQKTKRILISISGLGIAAFCTVFTRDLYYETLIFVIFTAYTIDPKHIIKISFHVLLSLTVLTVLATILHILPMVNSPRGDGSGARWGLGFYHSNVLPLILFYLIAYSIMLHKKRIKLWEMALWLALALIIFYFCASKNGLISIGLLCLGCLLYRNRKKESKFLLFIVKYSIIVLSVISLVGMLTQSNGGSFAVALNKFLTGRFGIAYRQYKRMGLHFINKMDWAAYKESREVLDNGYLYVAMRYGLIYLPFYWAVHILFAKKNKNATLALGLMIILSLTNFIDNDLNSYGYIPFILLAFNKRPLIEPKQPTVTQEKSAWIH